MNTVFQIGSTRYDDDKIQVIKALSHLQTLCEISDGYQLGNPVTRFGWTFVPLMMKSIFLTKIEEKFSDMINKSKGRKNDDKLTNFMVDFFESRGCKIKIKLVGTD